MKKIFNIFFLLFFTCSLLAQPRMNYKRKFKIERPFAEIFHATGWKKEGDKWYSDLNQIKDIDNFNNYVFSLVPIGDETYLYLSVNYESMLSSDKEVYQLIDGMLLPLDDYQNQVLNLSDDNTLRFPLTAYDPIIADRLGVTLKFGEIGKYIDFNLVMKFRFYDNNITHFLFYIEAPLGWLVGLHGDKETFKSAPLRNDSKYANIINSDALFENFFYEMDTNKFLDFIKAPLDKY